MSTRNHALLIIQGEPEFPTIPSIYKVPHVLRIGSENKYEPVVASFGPYHHQKKTFEVTEDDKMLYVENLIGRRTNVTFDILIAEIKKVEVEVRACYAETIDVEKFVEMMVIDGCFLLELVYKYKKHEKLLSEVVAAATEVAREAAAKAVATMCKKDPIFRVGVKVGVSDLLYMKKVLGRR